MSLWDSLKTFLAIEPMQERDIDSFVDHPGLTEQLAAIQGLSPRPWRVAGLTEALGVPAIFRAVSLIANTTGSLAIEAYRKGAPLLAEQRPRIIVRPNPFTTPRDFYRDTAYSMATRGEAWWWVASRDIDGSALSLLPVNPAEVTVSEDERDLRYPIIEWRGRRMPNADMVQITLLREPGALRGVGPLQMCGAAISVAVESRRSGPPTSSPRAASRRSSSRPRWRSMTTRSRRSRRSGSPRHRTCRRSSTPASSPSRRWARTSRAPRCCRPASTRSATRRGCSASPAASSTTSRRAHR